MLLVWGLTASHALNTGRVSRLPEEGGGNSRGWEHWFSSLFSRRLRGHRQVAHSSKAGITLPTSRPLPLGTVGPGNGAGVTYRTPRCAALLSARH